MAKVRIRFMYKNRAYTAEHQGATDVLPARVDIWRDLAWVEQRQWVPEVGIGDVIQKAKVEPIDGEVIGRIATDLRDRGL